MKLTTERIQELRLDRHAAKTPDEKIYAARYYRSLLGPALRELFEVDEVELKDFAKRETRAAKKGKVLEVESPDFRATAKLLDLLGKDWNARKLLKEADYGRERLESYAGVLGTEEVEHRGWYSVAILVPEDEGGVVMGPWHRQLPYAYVGAITKLTDTVWKKKIDKAKKEPKTLGLSGWKPGEEALS